MNYKTWTEEQEAELRILHASDLSYSQIAAALNSKFGAAVTGSSVSARVWRLKLPSRKKEPITNPAVDPRMAAAARHNSAVAGALVQAINRGPKLVHDSYKPRTVDVSALDIDLMELTIATCRFPTTKKKSGWKFCGLSPKEGSVYCAAHHSLSYMPPKQRAVDEAPLHDRRAA